VALPIPIALKTTQICVMVVHSLKVLALSYLFCSLLHISFADTVDPCVGEHFCARQPEIAKIVL
jgi:hypothetical protein